MDCDDISLPDSDLLDQLHMPALTICSGGSNSVLPMRSVVISTEDPPSLSEIQQVLDSDPSPVASLDVSHCELADAKTRQLLELLSSASSANSDSSASPRWSAPEIQAWSHCLQTITRGPSPENRFGSIRNLILSNNDITSLGLASLSAFVRNNVYLRRLNLTSNQIGPDQAPLVELASSIGTSGLRSLELSNNPILANAFIAFVDALPASGTSLEHLEMSCVLAHPAEAIFPTPTESLDAARAVARLIADDTRCRGLRKLTLNGNSFGYKGVRAIVAAQVGTAFGPYKLPYRARLALTKASEPPIARGLLPKSQRRPNRSIEHIELMGNVDEESAGPTDEALDQDNAVASFLRNSPPSRRYSISRYFLARASSSRMRETRLHGVAGGIEPGMASLAQLAQSDQSGQVSAPSHIRSRSPSPVTHSESAQAEQLIAEAGPEFETWQRDAQEAIEIGSGVDLIDWRVLLKARLELNSKDGQKVRRAALAVLSVARTLSCCVKKSQARPEPGCGFPQFLSLPPELRLHVLRQLNPEGVLSERQLNEVVSWAQDPSTIGYGEPGYPWSLQGLRRSDGDCIAVLPSHSWSWPVCFRFRSPPRDWTAELIDGHAGYGGLFPRDKKASSPSGQTHPFSHYFTRRPSHHEEEPSSPFRQRRPRPVSGATLAFWECTATDRPDSHMTFEGQPLPLDGPPILFNFSTGALITRS